MNSTNENTSEKKLFTPVFWITSIICILPIILGIILYDKLPQDIPQQYGWNNQVNWTLPKPWGIILCPIFILIMNFVMHFSLKITTQNINKKIEVLMQWMMCIIGLSVNSALILIPAGFNLDVFLVVAVVLGILFIIVGNYLPKTEPNRFVGVRAPWIINNPTVWVKTHRFSSKVFVISGFAILLTCFTKAGKYVLLACAFAISILPLIYSLIAAKKYKDNE